MSATPGAAAFHANCLRFAGKTAALGKAAAPDRHLREFYAAGRKRLKKRLLLLEMHRSLRVGDNLHG